MAHREAEAADIGAAEDPWVAAMRRGDFARAWHVADTVLQRRLAAGETCRHWPRHMQYVWTGVPLTDQRVLVRCYHGLGDTIQFARLAAPLRRIAAEVTLWAQPALLPLVATAAGVDRALPLHDGTPDCDYDVDIEIMELPHALRLSAASLPRTVPYLFPAPKNDPTLPADSHLNVGMVWAAGDWDPRRSVPVALLHRLTHIPGIRLYALQRGRAREQAAALAAIDISCDDVETTATRMRRLDLIISVDTMAAHLAGALGLPVWTLLHADCDWRWMEGRADSVWYPTMRLFRQPCPGAWDTVMAAVESSLRALSVGDQATLGAALQPSGN
jgi:hypothetical protein